MKKLDSPNHNERAVGCSIRYVILHYTGTKTAEEALTCYLDPAAKISPHYMIDENGQVYHLVGEDHRAWHAGLSRWQGQDDINSLSIGIELVNPGHEHGYRAFPSAQIDALKTLLKDIFSRYALPPSALLAHSDVAPTRRSDPGELFPWQELAKEGLGLWPSPLENAKQEILRKDDLFKALETIGYDIGNPHAALTAFHRHYFPNALDKGLLQETCAIVQGLLISAEPSVS